VERRGDIRLQQAQFFTPATQQNVQRFSDSIGWIHKISPCVNENVVTESRSLEHDPADNRLAHRQGFGLKPPCTGDGSVVGLFESDSLGGLDS
jgi:hypothetical protein